MKRIIFLFVLLLPLHGLAAERILALSPHACEILYAIGAGSEAVGAVDYCDYPETAKRLPRVGTYDRIHAEAAMALHPTMAVALNDRTPGIAALRRLGVRIVISRPETVRGVFDDIERLGRLTGHAAAAAKLADSLRGRLKQLEADRPALPPKVFYELWPEPLMTLGGKGFMQDVLVEAGARNVFAGLPMENARVSIESVMRAQPSIIIVPAGTRDVEARRQFWRHWLGDGIRIVTVDPDLLQRPGPRLVDGIVQLRRAVAGAAK
ncbi:MAG TPA: helical backbone metal receptor [Mariprofundaceae bacterium]|nr:helical backbone metal receptor [Mariprofundaceae bacterium]